MPLREGLVGLVIGVASATILFTFLRPDDPRVRGDWAEQWTAEAFGKVKGWQVVNGLSFDDGDLDHLVITPSGVLAVETKYRFQQPDARRLAAQRRGDLEATARAARKTANLLRSKDVAQIARVTPVLMMWGKGRPDLPDGYAQVDGIYVLDGEHPGLWTHLFSAPLLSPATRAAIHDALTKFQRKQIVWAGQRNRPMRSVLWSEFRTGLREAEEQRREIKVKRSALGPRHGVLSERNRQMSKPKQTHQADV